MRQYIRGYLLIAVSGVVFITFCYLGMEFMYGMIPRPATLARQYLQAIVNKDLAAIEQMAGSDPGCRESTKQDAELAIAQYGGAEIRGVSVEVLPQGGSDRGIRAIRITFEYRASPEMPWQSTSIRMITDSNTPGFRYLCGSHP